MTLLFLTKTCWWTIGVHFREREWAFFLKPGQERGFVLNVWGKTQSKRFMIGMMVSNGKMFRLLPGLLLVPFLLCLPTPGYGAVTTTVSSSVVVHK